MDSIEKNGQFRKNLQEFLEFRSKNTYFTKTAREIFQRELGERKKEISRN